MHVFVKSKCVCSNFHFHLFELSSIRTLCILYVTVRLGSRHSTLHSAANHGHFKVVEILLHRGTDIDATENVIMLFYKWYNPCIYVPFIWLNLQAVNNGCIYMYMNVVVCEWIFIDILLSISHKYLCLSFVCVYFSLGHRTLHCCTEWPPQGHRDPLGAGVIRHRSQVRDDCERIQWLSWPLTTT